MPAALVTVVGDGVGLFMARPVYANRPKSSLRRGQYVANETDRVFSFRLSHITHRRWGERPDDGYYVLQAGGSELKAAQVRTQRPADGGIVVVNLEIGI